MSSARPPFAFLLLVTASTVAGTAGVAPAAAAPARAARPSRVEVLRVLKQAVAGTTSVSAVLDDIGEERYPVLFFVGGKDCVERTIDSKKEQSCSPVDKPFVAVVRRGADRALRLDSELALPVAAPPWTRVEEPKWGVTQVKDVDGDGRPELVVVYGYHGPMVWAVGDVSYKHLAIVNLDAVNLAFQTVLDRLPQAATEVELRAAWKLVPPPAPGQAQDLLLTRQVGTPREGGSGRSFQESTERWAHGAGDRYRRAE